MNGAPHRRPITLKRIYPLAIVAVYCALLVAPNDAVAKRPPQRENPSAWRMAQSDPVLLIQAASQNELAIYHGPPAAYRYLLHKITPKSDTVQQMIATSGGVVARRLSIDGKPLTAQAQQAEADRLRTLETNPALQQDRLRSEARDAARIREIMRLLPKAFLYKYSGPVQTPNGPAICLAFQPNPGFSPPDLQSRVLTGIRGDVWIDPVEERLVRIDGHLFKHVDYGWGGLLGSIEPGGTILIEQARSDSTGWHLAHLKLNMQGKALLVKTVHLDVDETASEYHAVPAQWTYRDAIRWLLAMTPPTS